MSDKPFPKNPYVIGVPLTGDIGFYGRRGVFTFVEDTLNAEHQNVIVLYGQRRVGKTSLLHQLVRQLKEDVVPVYFDLQGKEQHSLGQVLYSLARTIARPLKMSAPEQVKFDNAGRFFHDEFLPSVYARLGQRRLLLLFDEFDVLSDELNTPEPAAETLFPYLQSLIMHERQVVFIFVVGRRIEELATHFQAIFKQAAYRRVSLLKPEDALALIVEPAKTVLTFAESAIEAILKLTAGHPYFTQLLCSEIFNAMKTRKQHGVEEADILNLVDQAIESGHGALTWFWDGLPRAERFIMSAVAHVTDETGLASKEAIRQVLEKHRIILTGLELTDAPDKLVEWEMLRREGPDNYRFVVELVRRWIIKTHPLESARRDIQYISQRAVRLYENAREAHTAGDLEYARDEYRRTLAANPNHSGAQLGLAQVLFELGQIEAAIEEFTKAYAFDEMSARDGLINVWTRYGDALAKEGKEVEAIEAYQRALMFSPQGADSATILTKKLEAVSANWTKLLEIHTLFTEAMEAHQKQDWGTAANRWQQLIQRGELKYKGHNLAALLSEAIEAHERLQQEQQALFEQGLRAQQAGDWFTAASSWQRLVDSGLEIYNGQELRLLLAEATTQKQQALFEQGWQAQERQDWLTAETAWQQLLDQGIETYNEQTLQPLLNQAKEMRLAQEKYPPEAEEAGKIAPRLPASPLLIGSIVIVGVAIIALILSGLWPSLPPPKPTPTATNAIAGITATLMPSTTTHRNPTPSLDQLSITPTPSTAAEATTTAEFQATVATQAVVAFKEDFISNVNGWRVGRLSTEWSEQTAQFIDGKYRWAIEAKQGLAADNPIPAFRAKDFRLSFEATIVEASDDPADTNIGIQFRQNENGDFYFIQFNSNGTYKVSLWSSQKDEWAEIFPQTSTTAFKLDPGEVNRFAIQIVDTSFTVYANSQKLTTVTNSTLSEAGELALATSLGIDQKLTVDFDNFIIEEIPLDKTVAEIEHTATARAAAPTATAMAYATAAAQKIVTFRDDFSSNEHGWPLGEFNSNNGYEKNEISQNKYRKLVQSKKGFLEWSLVPNNFAAKDFRLSVEATFTELPEGYADISIIFRRNGGNYYRVKFNDDGTYSVRLIIGDQGTFIYSATANNNAFNLVPNQPNIFALQVTGSHFTIYANDQELATVIDNALSEAGQVGLGIGLDKANLTARVDFDNLIIEEIPLDQTVADIKSTATARANAIATAQAEPTATALARNAAFDYAPELFREEFDSNTRGWQDGPFSNDLIKDGQAQFEEGKYRISMTMVGKNGFLWLPVPTISLKDFWLRVEATIIETSALEGDAIIYVGFRENSNTDNYQVEFSNDSKYHFGVWQEDMWQEMQKWTSSETIRLEPGGTNTFEILAKEANLTIYANGQELYNSVPETVLNEEGEFWLGISLARAGQTITVDFDNLIIKETP